MKKMKSVNNLCYLFMILFFMSVLNPLDSLADEIQLSSGQNVYVPIYSHIYGGVKARPFNLAAILSIRNTDPKYPITIVAVKYYDSKGKLIKDYIDAPVKLEALVSTRYIISEGDKVGGSGANYIVEWNAEKPVNPPIIEAVMIGTKSGQGISFVSRGQEIQEHSD